jgi:hemerythrin-like metal-binding protein
VSNREQMTVGVEAIDVHHRQLSRRIERLANAARGGDAADVRAALRSLQVHLAEHQPHEERWMEQAGYPGIREHARAHAALVGRIAAARADEAAGSERRLLEAAAGVARAVESHMQGDDLRLGRFWTARQNLRRLAEAGPGAGAALTPLPGSLSVYFPQVRRGDDERAPMPVPFPPTGR